MRESDRALERMRSTIQRQRDDLRERDQLRPDLPGCLLLALIAALGVLLAALVAASAGAQRRASDLEVLARITVHEAGWEDRGDMEAIFAVLRSGAEREGLTWRAFAAAYSPRLHAGTVSRRWAAELVESCTAPPSWPTTVVVRRDGSVAPHAPWSAFRARCLAVMERARAVLAGERTDGCEVTPHDWGGDCDMVRADRIGLIEIDCSRGDVETVGHYFVRPSLVESSR
jgi:hypothetical protein